MRNTSLVAIALAAFLAAGIPVLAQIAPGDTGAGVERGVQQLDQSGQVGTVTLFNSGATTRVVLNIKGVPSGRVESAHIHRGKGCDPGQVDPKPVYPLSNVSNGQSSTVVHATEDKLLSGNYVVIVHAGNMSEMHGMMMSSKAAEKYMACGYLYRS